MKQLSELISIVILHYNRKRLLDLCLDSVRRHTLKPYELIIVDNGSPPPLKDYLKSLPDITLVDLPENISPERAHAMGVSIATGKYRVIMTDDFIATPEWVTRLIFHAQQNPHVGMIGPRLNSAPVPQLVGSISYKDVHELDEFAKRRMREHHGRLTKYTRLFGGCLFVKEKLIQKIGWTDPRIPYRFNYDDLCIRANLAGFLTCIAQDVFIHHFGDPQESKDKECTDFLLRSWEVFKDKWKLPPDLPVGKYHPRALVNREFDPKRDYIRVPERKEVEPYIYRKAKSYYPVSQAVCACATVPRPSDVPAKEIAQGLAAYYLGHLDDAVSIFKGLSTRYQTSFHVQMALGCSLAKIGGTEEAISHLRVARYLQPNSCRPGNALGRALLKAGRDKEAEHAFEQADEVSLYSHQAKFNLIRYYVSKGKTDQAIEIALRAYQRDRNNNKVITILAHLLIVSKRYKEATEYLQHYLNLSPKDPNAFLLLFKAYWENGDKAKAFALLRIIESVSENDKDISNHIQSLLDVSQNEAEEGDAIDVILGAAGSLYDKLNWEDDFSIDFLVEGDILEGLYELANELHETGHTDEAFIIYKTLKKLAPDHALVHNDLGVILCNKGEIEAALKHISRALELNPWNRDIIWNSGQALATIGAYESASALYKEYLEMNPNDREMAKKLRDLQRAYTTEAV